MKMLVALAASVMLLTQPIALAAEQKFLLIKLPDGTFQRVPIIATITPTFDGKSVYRQAYEKTLAEHYDLADPAKRAAFSNKWHPDNVNSACFKSKAKTNALIQTMLISLGRKFDAYFAPGTTKDIRDWEKKTNTVQSQVYAGNILFIRPLSILPHDCDKEFQSALAKERNCAGLILDLRNNTGGEINKAMNIIATMLPSGVVAISKKRIDDRLVTTTTSLEKTRWVSSTLDSSTNNPVVQEIPKRTALVLPASTPIIVLVNHETASAAELIAAALQQNNRAVIMGTRTMGKGTGMQPTFFPETHTSMRVTNQLLFPGGIDINGHGITPNVVIEQPIDTTNDVQFNMALKSLQKLVAPKKAPPPPAKEETKPRPQVREDSPYVRFY